MKRGWIAAAAMALMMAQSMSPAMAQESSPADGAAAEEQIMEEVIVEELPEAAVAVPAASDMEDVPEGISENPEDAMDILTGGDALIETIAVVPEEEVAAEVTESAAAQDAMENAAAADVTEDAAVQDVMENAAVPYVMEDAAASDAADETAQGTQDGQTAQAGEGSVALDEQHFPDPAFREWLRVWDRSSSDPDTGTYYSPDGILSAEEISAITYIGLGTQAGGVDNISLESLKGIEYLTGLTSIYLDSAEKLTSLDVRELPNLETLTVRNCSRLTSMNVDNLLKLETLSYEGNALASLNISDCPSLVNLYDTTSQGEVAGASPLSIKLNNCDQLKMLSSDDEHQRQWRSLEVSGCSGLEKIEFISGCNNLAAMSVKDCPNLQTLRCFGCLLLEEISVSNCPALKNLECDNSDYKGKSAFKSLSLSGCSGLEFLSCDGHDKLTSLDVSGLPNLKTLECYDNANLITLDVSVCPVLKSLTCGGSGFSSLDVSTCPTLESLYCHEGGLTSLNVNGCSKLRLLYCSDNKLTSLDVSGCPGLKDLYCSGNSLTSLDLSGCTELETVECESNGLTSLNVDGCAGLESIYCGENSLTNLDVSGNAKLKALYCGDNSLESLDLKSCKKLNSLYCSNNKLTSLDLSGNPTLYVLSCQDNMLEKLDLSKNAKLAGLHCENNCLMSLDLSGKPALGDKDSWEENGKGVVYFSGQKASLTVPKVGLDWQLDLTGLVGNTGNLKITSPAGTRIRNGIVTFTGKAGTRTLTYNYKTGYKKTSMDVTLTLTLSKSENKIKITGLKKNRTLKKGKKFTLKPKLVPSASEEKITYKSSNKKVATVTAKGVVKGLKKGKAKITVKAGDAKFVVTVKVK